MRGRGTVAEECSNQFAKFMMIKTANMMEGYAKDVSIAQANQLVPWNIL